MQRTTSSCCFYVRSISLLLLKICTSHGLGSDNLIEIPSDERGRMCPERLRKQIEAKESDCVLFLWQHRGTTVLGAYDPFDRVAEICEDTECSITWMLVGGGAMLSRRFSRRGLNLADSVSESTQDEGTAQCSVFWHIMRKCWKVPTDQCGLLVSTWQTLCRDGYGDKTISVVEKQTCWNFGWCGRARVMMYGSIGT